MGGGSAAVKKVIEMLTEILQYLRNWFFKDIFTGTVIIEEDEIKSVNGKEIPLLDGQYFRIIGSALNDGVWQVNNCELSDETFYGTVWGLAIPHAVLNLAAEISAWQNDHGTAAASPYTSESFGGYSYSKASGENGDTSWQSVFKSRLSPWRKI